MNDQKYVSVNQGTANQSGGLQKIQLIQSNGQGTQMINGQPVTLLQVSKVIYRGYTSGEHSSELFLDCK